VITGAHGVRGQVRIKSFTERPEDVAAYGEVGDEAGARLWRLRAVGRTGKGHVLAAIEGIADRDAAAALKGERLYVPRARLPRPEEDEYYHADLIGLEARLEDGELLGTVRAVYDFGAGDVLEVVGAGAGVSGKGVVMVPFTRAAVPKVDPDAGWLVVVPPPGLLEPGEAEPSGGTDGGDNGGDAP
jgi:16S rRNA processing protein RimM